MDDEEFLRRVGIGLEPCDHHANLRLAWLLVRSRPLDEAIEGLVDAIGRRARRRGGHPDRDLTARWAVAVAVATRRSPDAATLTDLLAAHPQLLDRNAVTRRVA